MSFAEFCDRRALSRMTRAAFEADIRGSSSTFDYRALDEWDRLFDLFKRIDRTRSM